MKRIEKRWKCCPEGHVLGEILRVEVNRSGGKYYSTRLKLFRHAMERSALEKGESGVVVAILEGTAPKLDCDLCASQSSWVIGEEALNYLLDGMRARNDEKRGDLARPERSVGPSAHLELNCPQCYAIIDVDIAQTPRE